MGCYDKDWARAERIRKHCLLGKEIFSSSYGYITITRMWRYKRYSIHVNPHYDSVMVSEFRDRYGMKYRVKNYEFLPWCMYPDGRRILGNGSGNWGLV